MRYHTAGILAPGEDIEGAVPGGGTRRQSGTSFATAVVSGIATLLLSLQKQRGERPSSRLVRDAILRTAKPSPSASADRTRFLAGRIDPAAANQMLSRKENEMPTITPSACECGGAEAPTLVYTLGQVGYDFGTEARRDSFVQQTGKDIHDPAEMLAHLQENPASAASLIWTLSVDATVIYAIVPDGPYASVTYERLREFLHAQLREGAERVSVPGIVKGSSTLLSGQHVPNIVPEVRGMYSWSTPHLVQAAAGEQASDEQTAGIANFLERVYYGVRNLGITPQDRAMNYAATNAFQVDLVYADALRNALKLDSIGVERSPICRPGSDCWDGNDAGNRSSQSGGAALLVPLRGGNPVRRSS